MTPSNENKGQRQYEHAIRQGCLVTEHVLYVVSSQLAPNFPVASQSGLWQWSIVSKDLTKLPDFLVDIPSAQQNGLNFYIYLSCDVFVYQNFLFP